MRHQFHFTSAPKATPAPILPDGPITGNGDLALIWSGAPERLRLYLTKCDFWRAAPGDHSVGGVFPIGYIEIGLPMLADSAYDVTQDLDNAVIEGRFSAAHTSAKVKTIVCATENTVLLELTVTRPGSSASVTLIPCEGTDSITARERMGDMERISRRLEGAELDFSSEAHAVLKDVSRRRAGDREVIRCAVSVVTDRDDPCPKRRALLLASNVDDGRYEDLKKAHARWWNRFYAKSSLSLPSDPVVENQWYADLYIMASCARNPLFPPGLWGNFVTEDGAPWHGDYHLNYNYQAPFYGLPVTNHIELMEGYDRPLEDYLPFARENARRFTGCRGIYFPVGIGPMGLDTSCLEGSKEHGILFLGQKSNASFCVTVIAMRWYATRDLQYAEKHGYPFLREAAEFWEDYLVYEDGRYVDRNDSLHEVEYYLGADYHPTYHDEVNPVISLGLIALTFQCLLDMREALKIDGDREEKWRHILEHLSKPVYYTRADGREAVRGTEEGREHSGLILQYVYPAGQVGSRSDPRLLAAMRRVLEVTDEWEDDNRFCTFYPAAVRLGAEPEQIMSGFHTMIDHRGLGNGLYRCAGGGIENNAAIPSTLGDMLLQSFEGILRLLPNWNPERDVAFTDFRANGAFLVSAELRSGVLKAEIVSEKGGTLLLERPGYGVTQLEFGGNTIPFDTDVVKLETRSGDRVKIG